MKLIIDIPEERYKEIVDEQWLPNRLGIEKAIANGIPLNDVLRELRKHISDLYNTDVTYDNGDYNTMDTPTLDKVLEYIDSKIKELSVSNTDNDAHLEFIKDNAELFKELYDGLKT